VTDQLGTGGGDGPSYEMLWDCRYCGAAKLLGVTHRFCPGCGAAQDPSARYFPPEGEETAVAAHRFVGADKICPACRAPQSAAATHCGACGAALDGAASAALIPDDGRKQAARAGRPAGAPPDPLAAVATAEKERRRRTAWRLIAGAVVALVALVAFFALYTRKGELVVRSHHWERRVQVAEFYQAHEQADCDRMPAQASVTGRAMDTRVRRVPDGQDCHEVCTTSRQDRGDGSFSTSKSCHPSCTTRYRSESYVVAVCRYDIGRWRKTRELKAQGDATTPAPEWPPVALAPGRLGFGQERIDAKAETYEVELQGDGAKRHRCGIAESLWAALKDGQAYPVDLDVFGAPRCKSLKL
jgi:hypothetical protein